MHLHAQQYQIRCRIRAPLLFALPQGWSHGNSRWKQPGPVEALKQMLFRLQAVEAELQRQQGAPAAFTLCGQQQVPEPRDHRAVEAKPNS